MKYAAPAVTGYLEGLRKVAADEGETVTAEFKLGTDIVHVTRKKAGQVLYEQDDDMGDQSLLKRNHRFLAYDWPDGGSTPATFTFTGTAAAQGGLVHFGTGHAETTIRVSGGRVVCDLGQRMPAPKR